MLSDQYPHYTGKKAITVIMTKIYSNFGRLRGHIRASIFEWIHCKLIKVT